jgi:hypothetical protein
MALWHVSFAADDRMPLFPSERLRRSALLTLAKIAKTVLVLFSIVDEHLHLVSDGDTSSTRRLRQALHQALGAIAGPALADSWCKPVKDRKHLLSLVRYHLVQVVKHSVQGVHPALWSGSCFQDLIGARLIPGLELRAAEKLPRHQITALACKEVGLPGFVARPVSVATLRELGITKIKAAAAAAVAADPALTGRTRPEILARSAAAQLGRLAGISRSEIRWALEVTKQGLSAMLKERLATKKHLEATGIRLALEAEVERRSMAQVT